MIQIRKHQSGFTIIELILAMTFFSFILSFATVAYVAINRSYVRGNNTKLIQEQARRVINEISSEIRLSNGTNVYFVDADTTCNSETSNPTSNPACRRRLCIGNVRYAWNESYIDSIDEKTATETKPFRLVKTTTPSDSSVDCDAPIPDGATELLNSDLSMVQDIDVVRLSASAFRLDVSLSTNDTDRADALGLDYKDIEVGGVPTGENKATNCIAGEQSLQFCHVETLSTIANKRVQ